MIPFHSLGMIQCVEDPLGGRFGDGREAYLFPFAVNGEHPIFGIELLPFEPRQLAEPKPRAVKELHDGSIPKAQIIREIGTRKEALHLFIRDGSGEPFFFFGALDLFKRVFIDELFPHGKGEKTAERGEAAKDRFDGGLVLV